MDELIETIDWLQEIPEAVLVQIFETSYKFLQGRLDKKDHQTLAESLQKTPEMLERTFEAVGFIITTLSSKKPLPEIPWLPKLEEYIKDKESEIKLLYSQNSLHNPFLSNFIDFDWRLEVQVSSRAIEDIITPKILLQITTDKEQRLLEADYANLKNFYNQLKLALKSFDSVRAKKAEKFLKPSKAI
jgi:COMM domain